MSDRTPRDMIDDMLKKGRSWIDIVSVGRVVRGGRWYEDIVKALQDDKLMPTDPEEINKARLADIAKPKNLEKPKYSMGPRKEGPSPSATVDPKG